MLAVVTLTPIPLLLVLRGLDVEDLLKFCLDVADKALHLCARKSIISFNIGRFFPYILSSQFLIVFKSSLVVIM